MKDGETVQAGRRGIGTRLVATVYRQFHKPTGFLGRIAGWILANRPSNIERNRWTVDQLEVHELAATTFQPRHLGATLKMPRHLRASYRRS